jgi:hypothetical protein
MYLAPINYDRFFLRVFQDKFIAKSLLEDLLDVTIQEIEPLARKAKLTDEAALVEFDYRCKIDGTYVIVDMQQWHKNDVVKRFYMYFCNNTSLQLEDLEPVSIKLATGKEYQSKDYHKLETALTIIWMAADRLGFKEDLMIFSMLPELLSDFVRDNDLWDTGDLQKLMEKRAQLLKILQNDTKNLSFLYKNRLIFAFQKNIIKNKQKMSKYFRWFEFAAKTSNPDNVATDFDSYYDHPAIFAAMKKLMTSELNAEDFQYITDYRKHEIGVGNYNRKLRQEVVEQYEPIVKQLEQDKFQALLKVAQTEKEKQAVLWRAEQLEREVKATEQEAKLKLEQTEQEAKLKLEQTEQEAKLKLEQTEQEAKLKLDQIKREVKLKLQETEKVKKNLEKSKEKLEKAAKLKSQQAKKEKQQLQKEAEWMVLQQQLLTFKKCLQRGDTKEDIMSFMEIDKKVFQQYMKFVEKPKK